MAVREEVWPPPTWYVMLRFRSAGGSDLGIMGSAHRCSSTVRLFCIMKRISRMLFGFEFVCMRCCHDQFCCVTRPGRQGPCEPTLLVIGSQLSWSTEDLACLRRARGQLSAAQPLRRLPLAGPPPRWEGRAARRGAAGAHRGNSSNSKKKK